LGRVLAVTLALILTTAALAGCGSEDKPKADPKASAEPTPKVPASVDATEPPRPTKQAETPQSALEYGRYFARLVQYGVETRNSRVINAEAFDQAGCTNCATIAKLISELKRTGYWQVSDPIKLGKLRAVPMQGGIRVQGGFVYPKVQNVKLNGKVGRSGPAAPYRYYVDLQWDDKQQTWQVLDFVYQRKG